MAGNGKHSIDRGPGRWASGSPSFSRVTSLSDGVFAIALTLLVFTLQVPEVPPDRLAGALVEQLPQLVAFALGFALVANLWWQHHMLFGLLEAVERGMVAINLVLLGAVALVPFPTNLVGSAPDTQAAAVPFIGLFTTLGLLYVLLLWRARRVAAWHAPDELFMWLLASWISGVVVTAFALLVAMWSPVAGLAIVGVTVVLGPMAARLSYGRVAQLTEVPGGEDDP